MYLIELSNVTFTYESEEPPVLQDFCLQASAGECLVIMGDNGSGKTTLFRILNGLSFPQKGKYLLDGEEIHEKYLKDNGRSKRFHKRVGYLFQNPDMMLFNPTVYDEIAFGPRQMGLSEEEVKMVVTDCLELFGIREISHKAPYHLSGGQKKKVALAAVMALNPEIMILDEPLAGLDRKSREWLIELLKELKAAGKTLLIATHDESLLKLGDSMIRLV